MITKKYIIALMTLALFLSCATNPFTGKQTMAFVSNDQLFPAAFQQYDQFLSENKVITGTSQAEMIKRVGQRIAIAAERYLNANGHEGYLKDYEWEYNLVDDKTVNAWCMPGGKIVFYTGILPIAKSETGIAIIMGHEVAHALANHGQQRMSAAYIQQGIAIGGNILLADDKNLDIYNQAYGIASNVGGMLPFSRSHESEADRIGIYLAAIAGYNPYEAPKLWERMNELSGGQAPPEFMSTHPSNESRIQELQTMAPKAEAEAKKFGVSTFRNTPDF